MLKEDSREGGSNDFYALIPFTVAFVEQQSTSVFH